MSKRGNCVKSIKMNMIKLMDFLKISKFKLMFFLCSEY